MSDGIPCLVCRNSKAPFNFVLNLMVPGAQKLALVITWAAEQNPSLSHQNSSSSAPSLQRDHSSVSSHADSDSEAGSGPFDILLARYLLLSIFDECSKDHRSGILSRPYFSLKLTAALGELLSVPCTVLSLKSERHPLERLIFSMHIAHWLQTMLLMQSASMQIPRRG